MGQNSKAAAININKKSLTNFSNVTQKQTEQYNKAPVHWDNF